MSENNPTKVVDSAIKLASDFLSQVVYPAITPSLKEFGEMAGDSIRYYRFKNEVNILTKTQAIAKEKGISVRRIPSKILVPLLENGSLEDEESMLDKWANLLFNAVNPNSIKETKEAYIEILKQLSPKEVLILDKFFEYYSAESLKIRQDSKENISIGGGSLKELSGIEQNQFEKCMDNILRLNLLDTAGLKFSPPQPGERRYTGEKEQIVFTAFGYDFVSVCRGN
jgi:hypothetical protein